MTRMHVLVAMVVLLWAIQVHPQGPLFGPAPGSPVVVGESSGKVALADVNGDGRLDMVTQHLQSSVVMVQLGDGTGHFAAAPGSPINLSYQPGDIRLEDLNGDKIPDLAVTCSDRDAVDILLGDGKGAFARAPASPFTVSAAAEFYTRSLQLVDLNEDGKLDVVTANHRRNTFATLLGNGRGGFSPGPTVTFRPGHDFYSFAFGDVDGDGHLDVVTASGETGYSDEPGRVVWLRGDGRGAFKEASEAPLSVPPGPRSVTLADMNGDGRPDVVIGHGSNQLSVLLNDGRGRFTPAPGSPCALGTQAFAVVAADVNQDRRNDLVVATVESVTVLLNSGSGFAPAPGSPFRAGPGAYHLTVGDINKDGRPDIVASSFEGNAVTVLLGR
ncbi:MAG TPA: VCBS repeat-containing protein [Blastocatellia bacterium]|nr:VCBS repeat-containing protein [Blastocatellia bacterium]